MHSPPIALEEYKLFLRDMGRLARDQLTFSDPGHPATLLQLARSIACVVWRNDAALPGRLLRSCPMAEDFLRVDQRS
eukprot:5670279-Pyramimonas_sp.AAC.1